MTRERALELVQAMRGPCDDTPEQAADRIVRKLLKEVFRKR